LRLGENRRLNSDAHFSQRRKGAKAAKEKLPLLLAQQKSVHSSQTHMDANMSTTLKIAAWKSWRPAEYFQEYFSHQVEPDERAAIPFQVEFLRRAGRAFPPRGKHPVGRFGIRVA
jgi:hypothetical protein